MEDKRVIGDLDGLINESELKNLLTYYDNENQNKFILNLISRFQTTESYKRIEALNIQKYEFTTSEEIYNMTGIEYIVVDLKYNNYSIHGNSDMLLRFPQLLVLYPMENDYLFWVHSLGSLKISDIRDKYIEYNHFNLLQGSEAKSYQKENSLEYTYNLNFLIDANVNFDDSLRFEFLKENINDIDFSYLGDSIGDIEILFDFIEDDNDMNQIVDLGQYSLTLDLVRYKDLKNTEKFEVFKYSTSIFKEVYFAYSDDDILTIFDVLNATEISAFIEMLRDNNIKLKPINSIKNIEVLKSIIALTKFD